MSIKLQRYICSIGMSFLFLCGQITSAQSSNIELYPYSTLCPATPFIMILPPPADFEFPLDSGASRFVVPDTATFIGQDTYGFPADTAFTLYYTATYYGGWTGESGSELPVRFYLIVDDIFVPIGENSELYLDTFLPEDQRHDISFAVPPLSEGIHTIIILAIGAYERIPDLRGDRDAIEYLSKRITIVAGHPDLNIDDPRTYTLLPEGITSDKERQAREQGTYRSELVPATSEEGRFWNDPEPTLRLSPNQEYTFYAQMGTSLYFADYSFQSFQPDETRRFAIFLLEDFQPVSIGMETLAYYGEMDFESVVVQFPITRAAPSSGRSDLVIIRVDEPDMPACRLIDNGGHGLFARHVVVEVTPQVQ